MVDLQKLIDGIKADIEEGKSEEEIFHTLQPSLGRDPEVDGKMAESLVSIPHEKIAKILQRLLEMSREKKVRKVIKRSLYRLKNRGIAVQETPVDREGSILHPLRPESGKGFGSGIDFLGQRLLLLVIPQAGRGSKVMQGVISDTQGLIAFSGEEMARKDFRKFFKEVQGKSLFPLVEMDPSYVGFLFTQAYQLTVEKKGTPPQDYLRWKSDLERVKKVYEKPLIYSYLPTADIEGNERTLKRTADLLKDDLFSSWGIEEDQIRPYADAVWEAEESKIVLNQNQKEARFQEIYLKALTELFSGKRRFLYKRRLEEVAYVLFKLGRLEEVKVCLAEAIDLENPVNPLNPNPFLFQLVMKSIFTLLAEAHEKKSKEPSLILKP